MGPRSSEKQRERQNSDRDTEMTEKTNPPPKTEKETVPNGEMGDR